MKTMVRGGAAVALGFLVSMAGCGTDDTVDEVGTVGQAVSFTRQLPVPPVLTPTSSDATTDYYAIEMKSGLTQIRATGSATPIWGYNGVYPGPTIMATKGRQVKVTQKNSLTENMTVHNHGHKVAASSDGHPTDYIVPGASKTYTYPNDQAAGTYWYHDHAMDITGPHVYKGLAAFYIIKDPAEDALNLPSGAYDVPLLIQDKSFVYGSNNLQYSSDPNREGFMGDVAVVNGAETPNLNVANRKYRFRLLNGSNARDYKLSLGACTADRYGGTSCTSKPFQIIASDGGLLAAPLTVTSLYSAPAERYDIVVDFSSYPVGTKLVLKNDDRSVSDIMQFTVNRTESDPSTVPATLKTITPYQRSQSAGNFNVVLDSGSSYNGGADWVINGLAYDPARIDVRTTKDKVYIWTLKNNTREMHPFHKHLVEFNILSINGQPPPPHMRGWKDTVPVQSNDTIEIIFKNETFTGTYVFHCHRLEHEDHRMMAQEAVQ